MAGCIPRHVGELLFTQCFAALQRDARKPSILLFSAASPRDPRTQYEKPLLVLFCRGAVVLLISCANIAINMRNAHVTMRCLRSARGVGGQLFTENLTMSLSVPSSLLLSVWGTRGTSFPASSCPLPMAFNLQPIYVYLAFQPGCRRDCILFGLGRHYVLLEKSLR